MTFVVATRKLQALPHWVRVSEVFKIHEDAPFLQRAGIETSPIRGRRSTASDWHDSATFAATATGWMSSNGR